jgi:hypothetical protein
MPTTYVARILKFIAGCYASIYITQKLMNTLSTPPTAYQHVVSSHTEDDKSCIVLRMNACYTFPLGNWAEKLEIMALCNDLYKASSTTVKMHVATFHGENEWTSLQYIGACSSIHGGLQYQGRCRAETASEALIRTSHVWNACLDSFGISVKVQLKLPDDWSAQDVVEQQVAAGKPWTPLHRVDFFPSQQDTCSLSLDVGPWAG